MTSLEIEKENRFFELQYVGGIQSILWKLGMFSLASEKRVITFV